ncbi:MAG: hypothetical protein HZB44_03165 [Actinobacteria bacterium]|nr:hypothetical protein [Actinomycetota bacterium]
MNKAIKAYVIPVAAFLMMTALMISAAGCNVSTANLSNVKVCDKIEDEQCPSDMSSLDRETPAFYVSADLDNAPSGTKIKIDWRYLSGEIGNEPQDIDSVSLTSEEDSNNVQSSLERATEVWPKGEYEVVLTIQTDNAEPIHKKFSVN